jgi:hypothetical protein
MQTIAIRVRARDLSAEMAAMRKWLDEHRCEPANFTFRRFGDIISIYTVFDKDADGEAFKARFGGQAQRQEADTVTEDLERLLPATTR